MKSCGFGCGVVGILFKGLKTKALLVKRYAQCIDFNSSLTVIRYNFSLNSLCRVEEYVKRGRNHVLALMFKVCKFSLCDSKNTSDLCDEEDEQPDLACTSQLQRWHKMGRGDKICQDMIAVSYLVSFAGTLCMNNLARDKT